MTLIGNTIGEICKIIFPISEDIFYGNQKSNVAICTLSSVKLLKTIATSDLMDNVAVVGRLLSENYGLDALIRFITSNKNISTILLCGKEVVGHRAGHSLLALHKNGIDVRGRIIGSTSPEPIVHVRRQQVEKFRKQVKIINKIGETNLLEIGFLINSIKN